MGLEESMFIGKKKNVKDMSEEEKNNLLFTNVSMLKSYTSDNSRKNKMIVTLLSVILILQIIATAILVFYAVKYYNLQEGINSIFQKVLN